MSDVTVGDKPGPSPWQHLANIRGEEDLELGMTEKQFADGFSYANIGDFEAIVRSALILKRKMYDHEDTKDALFKLRKALEGIWGHDTP